MSEELKYCKFCNKQKPKNDFCKSGGFTKNICRECHNKKQKERYANSKLVEEKDKEIERLNDIIDETRRILGEYKHFSTPTEEQNSENEEIVDKAYIKLHSNLQEPKGDSSNE